MRRKILAIVSGLFLTSALALVGTPAHAATPKDASPWVAVYLHAYSGNGCASYNVDQYLEPITSEPCQDSQWWYFRDLSRSSGAVEIGDNLEFVDYSKTYALGYSGGELKLVTPNDSSTYVTVWDIDEVGDTGPWQALLTLQDDYDDILPNGAGDPLQLPASSQSIPPDAWLECSTADPTCNGGVLT
jgi:hypothetical protein